MPGPVEILFDPLSLVVFALYGAFVLVESLFPARELPKIAGWRIRSFCAFVVFFYLATYLPMVWDAYLLSYQLVDLRQLNPYIGAVVGLLVFNFFLYVWHRLMHESNVLWRVFHQFHHSAERVDTFGAFYFSPMDIIGFTFLGSVSLVLVAGLSVEAATLYLYASVFLPLFQHMNVKTPTWIGYVIQRPESHSVHHEKGIHAYNYADLPIFDMLFGTFKNPTNFAAETGFYSGASSRVMDMLMCHDVSVPKDESTLESKPLG